MAFWQQECQALLELLMSSQSPVGAAVCWLRTHGRTGVRGNSSSVGGIWRFVPDVLAKEVVFLEEPQGTGGRGTVGNCLWLQTLPAGVQANVLTFLATEHARFRNKDLELLAKQVLSAGSVDYWVSRAAHVLLTTISAEEIVAHVEESNYAVPGWLLESAAVHGALFDWLPLQPEGSDAQEPAEHDDDELSEASGERRKMQHESNIQPNLGQEAELGQCSTGQAVDVPVDVEENGGGAQEGDQELAGIVNVIAGDNQEHADRTDEELLGAEVFRRATSLRETLLSPQLVSCHSERLKQDVEMFRLVSDVGVLLRVLRPCEFDDDVTLSLVGSLLGDEEGYAWSTQIMSSVILPKLLNLSQPASRLLLMAVLQAAKSHPRGSVDSILVPLLYAKQGASNLQCEVINRVVVECMTLSSISLFLRNLFKLEAGQHSYPSSSHLKEGCGTLVWTEPMVGILQSVLNFRGLSLEQDVTDALVLSLHGVADQFAGSLKFGNLVLNLVSRHGSQLNPSHVRTLHQVVERTSTFLTKSLIAKLNKL